MNHIATGFKIFCFNLFLVRGGLTLREGIEIMEAVHRTNRLQVMDLVEVNPKIGTALDVKITVDAAKHIILAAFGHKRGGCASYNTQKL